MLTLSKLTQQAALTLTTLALTACGTSVISKDVNNEGVAKELVFPEIKDAWIKGGTSPAVGNVRNVKAGMSKDQVRDLLGISHFSEGFFSVREWDFLFNFPQAVGGARTCQYKVVFDTQLRAQSFHWLPDSCASLLDATSAALPAADVSVK